MIERQKEKVKKAELVMQMYRHLIGFFMAFMELWLGHKPDVKE